MSQVRRFSQLSPARQALVRVLQAVNFGEIQAVHVRDADPVFDDGCVVMIDAKLDKEEVPRRELDLPDFELRGEVGRLMSWLDEMKNGTILRLDVRAGIPRRLVFYSAPIWKKSAEHGSSPALSHASLPTRRLLQ
jgi:hypothetical protein